MIYTKKELHHLEQCLGRCSTCSEQRTCKLKAKVDRDEEIDGILYDAQCGYYSNLYKLTRRINENWLALVGIKEGN